MQRPCDACGSPYEAKRRTSRFCSTACRVRNGGKPSLSAAAPPKGSSAAAAELVAVTERELQAAGVLGTVLGAMALALARRLTSAAETGSAAAALSKELRAVMAQVRHAHKQADLVDELRARRNRKRIGHGTDAV